MKQIMIVFLTVGLVLTSGLSALAEDGEPNFISLEARYFTPTMEFAAKSDGIEYRNGEVNFVDDLGLVTEDAPELRIKIADSFRLDLMQFSNSGSSVLTDTLEYEGYKYDASAEVNSIIDITYARAIFSHRLFEIRRFKTIWALGVTGFEFDTKIKGKASAIDGFPISGDEKVQATKSFQGAIPIIGLGSQLKFDADGRFKLVTEVTGLPVDKYGYFFDAEAGLEIAPFRHLVINLSYRLLDLKLENEEDGETARFKLSGPYAGLILRF